MKIDLARREALCGTEKPHLTPIEYKLLTLFARHAGKVLTHRHSNAAEPHPSIRASGALRFTASTPLSRVARVAYIWLVPMTSPFFARSTK